MVAAILVANFLAGCASPKATPPTTAVASATPAAELAGIILFQTDRDPGRPFFVVEPDGTNLRSVAIELEVGGPALSPDGASLAFARDKIFVGGLDGTNVHAFSAGEGLTGDVPAWAPDGHRVAFIEHGAGIGDTRIVILDLDTGGLTELAAAPSGDRPGWSPTARLIVYGNSEDGGLASFDLDRHVVTRLTHDDDSFASYSPDGRLIAFERSVPTTEDHGFHHIVVAFADGSNPQFVTSGALDDEFPAWSPDGDWIVFARLDGKGGAALWRVRPTGADLTRITPDGAADSWPSWAVCPAAC